MYKLSTNEVSEEYEWYGAFHSIFSDSARYDAGVGECTMAVNDNIYDATNEELMDDIGPIINSPSFELCATPQGELKGNDVLVVANSGENTQKKTFSNKQARGRTNEGAEEVEVVPFKLSGKSLAVAQTNATLKLKMLQELASKRSYDRAEMVQEKARLKRELLGRNC